MPGEKFYCGSCGAPLYFGRKFQEHTPTRPCPSCEAVNPTSFHFCYRCGERILAPESVEESA